MRQQGYMPRHLVHPPAPNFGKTAGISKSPALAGSYGGAKGFSEVGGRGKRLILAAWLALFRKMRSKGIGMVGLGTPLLRPRRYLQLEVRVAGMPDSLQRLAILLLG